VYEATAKPQLHHWLNTLAGQIDAAFSLTQEELYAVTKILSGMLENLDLEGRDDPAVIPTPLLAEMNSRYWAIQLHSVDRLSSHASAPRSRRDEDTVVSLDAWRNALVDQLLTAYPCISPIERVITYKTMDSLLDAIGVQFRSPKYIPESMIAHHNDAEGM
jgi:hypothetical protein